MQDFDDFLAECDLGPRINELTGFFTATAAGKSGMPIRRPAVDVRLLPKDELLHNLIGLHDPPRLFRPALSQQHSLSAGRRMPDGLRPYEIRKAPFHSPVIIQPRNGGRHHGEDTV